MCPRFPAAIFVILFQIFSKDPKPMSQSFRRRSAATGWDTTDTGGPTQVKTEENIQEYEPLR